MKYLIYLFYPLTFLYRFLFYLDKKITKKQKLPNAIVISIGNLSLGGTGKTPFTMYLLAELQKLEHKNLVLLSRGYGGSKSKEGMRVELDSNPRESGDEPFLIKSHFSDVQVLIGRNRYSSFQKFYQTQNEKAIVLLDDGFQHHALVRDLDFVLIDSCKLLGNGLTIPVGFLRETQDSLERADVVVFTKVKDTQEKKLQNFKQKLQMKFPKLKIFHFLYQADHLENISKNIINASEMKGKKIFSFCGIGNPDSFFSEITSFSPQSIEIKIYSDHFQFGESELEFLKKKSLEFDLLLCTEKDFVKLRSFSLPSNLYFLKMKSKVLEEREFLENLLASLNAKKD